MYLTEISQLSVGDMIYRVDENGHVIVKQYLGPHPSYPSEYSLMLDKTTEDAQKFYNRQFGDCKFRRYSDKSFSVWTDIYLDKVNNAEHKLQVARCELMKHLGRDKKDNELMCDSEWVQKHLSDITKMSIEAATELNFRNFSVNTPVGKVEFKFISK